MTDDTERSAEDRLAIAALDVLAMLVAYLRTQGANANYDDPWQTGYREGCRHAADILEGK